MSQIKNIKLSLLALTITTSGAFASTTGVLNLSGSVDVNYSIDVAPTAAATDLNIEDGETATKVADVTEITNNPAGYKVTLESANAGELVHNSVLSSVVAYTLDYDGNVVSPDGNVQTAKSEASQALSPGNVSEVKISFTGLGTNAIAGTYSDTVTFEIGAP
jgi:hypothetical protein